MVREVHPKSNEALEGCLVSHPQGRSIPMARSGKRVDKTDPQLNFYYR